MFMGYDTLLKITHSGCRAFWVISADQKSSNTNVQRMILSNLVIHNEVMAWKLSALLNIQPVIDRYPLQSSNAQLWCFFMLAWTDYWRKRPLSVNWDALMHIRRHCNSAYDHGWPCATRGQSVCRINVHGQVHLHQEKGFVAQPPIN